MTQQERKLDRQYEQLREAIHSVPSSVSGKCYCNRDVLLKVDCDFHSDKAALLRLLDKAQAAGVEIE